MKRTLSICLLALLLACLPSAALAQEALMPAATALDHTRFERYVAYQYDEESGDWFVRGNGAEVAMKQIAGARWSAVNSSSRAAGKKSMQRKREAVGAG